MSAADPAAPPTDDVRIAIIGAGFGGIGLAVKLRAAGISDFALLERADALGGTWRDNTYPGCACDVASHLYSYSFAPNPDWSRAFSRQPEILAYLQRVAREHDVERHIRLGVVVRGARWDDEGRAWVLDTSHGELRAQVLVSATGVFGEPSPPAVPGFERFRGKVFHSLDWDHAHDLTGERVAVIGTGASAVQFVPEIRKRAGRVTVFQRTPPWILPRPDRRTSGFERALLHRVPLLGRLSRAVTYASIESLGLVIYVDRRFRFLFEALGRLQLRRQVKDPELRARLTPDYAIGCKRVILSDAWYPALCAPNVEVVSDAVAEVRERSIVSAGGEEREVDTIICGTGFAVPSQGADLVIGREGRSVLDVHAERPRSYNGTVLAGFPNFFMLLGPFSGSGNQSALYTMESQMTYVVDAVRTLDRTGARVAEVRPDRQEAFTAEAERRSADAVWVTGGCTSYYLTPDGRNAGLWPNWSFMLRHRLRRFDPDAYDLDATLAPTPTVAETPGDPLLHSAPSRWA